MYLRSLVLSYSCIQWRSQLDNRDLTIYDGRQLRRVFNTKQSFKQYELRQKERIIWGCRGFLSSAVLFKTTWNSMLSGFRYDVQLVVTSWRFPISTLRKVSPGFG